MVSREYVRPKTARPVVDYARAQKPIPAEPFRRLRLAVLCNLAPNTYKGLDIVHVLVVHSGIAE